MLRKLSKLLITSIIFLITIILFKSNPDFKNWYQKKVLNNTFSFTTIASKYEELFGNPIPFKNYIVKPVFNEKLKYKNITKYKDGYLVDVESNLIPSISEGLITFIGNKDGNLCVLVEQNKVEINYCMFKNIAVKLYDHVEAGSYLGEVDQKLFLTFSKNGEFLGYEEFI